MTDVTQDGRYAQLGHPLQTMPLRRWIRLCRFGGRIDPRYRPRAASITLFSLLSTPMHVLERALYAKSVESVQLLAPPVFIVGHWRTGTTHLHYLMDRDPALATVSLYQAMFPSVFFTGYRTIRPLVEKTVPRTRPMDNMALSMDLPQEEEFAVCNQSRHSPYTGWYFPRHLEELFEKYTFLNGLSKVELAEWKRVFLFVLRQAALRGEGRRLVLKNPVNTGRIGALRELFPDAKFIFLYRNPYVVFKSTLKLHRVMLERYALQDPDFGVLEGLVLRTFREMMARYFEESTSIPEENLVEVRFEDLEARPMEELERIYATLGLAGWEEASPCFEDYLEGQRGYVKNQFDVSDEDIAKVEEHWGFAIDRWGYERPDVGA